MKKLPFECLFLELWKTGKKKEEGKRRKLSTWFWMIKKWPDPSLGKKSTGCFNIFSLCVNVIFSSYLQSLQHEARITKRLTLFFVSQTHASTTLVIVFKWTEVIDRQEFLVWLQTLWSIDYYSNWTFLYTDFLQITWSLHLMFITWFYVTPCTTPL